MGVKFNKYFYGYYLMFFMIFVDVILYEIINLIF